MTRSYSARLRSLLVALLALSLILAGCATQPPQLAEAERAKPAMPSPEIQERLLALDPDRISDRDVQDVLAKSPAPRIMLLHGGIYPVHLLMESFGHFLRDLGYPAERIRDPRDGSWSYSPYEDSAKLAGIVAWDYERTGLRPMLIGHSQGGMQAVKVLYELAGKFAPTLHAYDPLTDRFEDRTTIVDPMTRQQRPIVGLSVAYASAVGAGGVAFLLPNQWSMLDKLDSIPNTVDDFTGFFIAVDPIGWSLPNGGFQHNGTAKVRNVELPATYSHIFVPLVSHLAGEREVRDWINTYVPGDKRDPSSLPGDAAQHVLWAADVWYSIKKHWCLEAQHWVRAHRARSGVESAAQ